MIQTHLRGALSPGANLVPYLPYTNFGDTVLQREYKLPFHSDETFKEVVKVLRKCVKLSTKKDHAWFVGMQIWMREEIEEILALVHEHKRPKYGSDKDFEDAVAKIDDENRKRGRPSQYITIGNTAVIALADLFERVVPVRKGVWTLPGSERSHFQEFISAAISPLSDDDLTDNSAYRWRRIRKSMRPIKRLRQKNLPSKKLARIGKTPPGQQGTRTCNKLKTQSCSPKPTRRT